MIIVANWKMNKNLNEAMLFLDEFFLQMSWCKNDDIKLIISPSFPIISNVIDYISDKSLPYNLNVCAQNCHHSAQGAFTGEVSANILSSLGINYVIIGHSERRKYFNESNDVLVQKLQICLKNNLFPIFCFGESKEERKNQNFLNVIEKQLEIVKKYNKFFQNIILAYEPIWSIGTGKTPSLEEIEEVHLFVKNILPEFKILYGGSLRSSNAKNIFSLSSVDGGLIGGASLNSNEFVSIIKTANENS